MSTLEVRLWGGPRCGEIVSLDIGIYGHLPDDLRFPSASQPSLEDLMNPDHPESRIVAEDIVYVLHGNHGSDGVVLYAYEPYVCH